MLNIIKFLLFNPFIELIIWIDYFINFIPGKIGKIIRILWFSIRFKKILKVIIDTNCEFKGLKNIFFANGVGISKNCSFYAEQGNIYVSEGTAFNSGCHINASIGGAIKIGKKCPIGPNVVMRTASHNYEKVDKFIQDQGHKYADINIADNCWIAANVIIVGGVNIGSGSVIGANSEVTKNIPPNSVAVGIPAEVIKNR